MNRTASFAKAAALLAPAALLFAAAWPASADVTYPGILASTSDRFGGKAAMDVWVQDLNYYVLGDNRINRIFNFGGDAARQKAFQDDVETLVLDSPVDQARADAIAAKYQLALTQTEYNAVIENAYLACEASRTRYHVCNQIVAALAPLERAAETR
jgi:hemoglobin